MSTVIVEIDSNILFDNNKDIELGNIITVPIVVKSMVYKKPESLLVALDTLEAIQDISDNSDLDCHDKEAYIQEILDTYEDKIK